MTEEDIKSVRSKTITVELNKIDLARLLQGTTVPYKLWDEMPSDLGKVEGGGWTDPEWKWNWMNKPYLKYSEEELYALYKKIDAKIEHLY